MSWRIASIAPVWLLALAGAIVVAVVAPRDGLIWLPVVMAACVVVALIIQLPVGRREGLTGRLSAAVVGALVILVLATALLWLVAPGDLRML